MQFQPLPPPPPKKRSWHNLRNALIVVVAVISIAAYSLQSARSSTPSLSLANQQATSPASVALTAASKVEFEETAVAVSNSTSLTETSQVETATAQPIDTSTPTTATQNDVGVAQQSSPWTITVNSAKPTQGGEFDTPKAGNIFILINFTAKNTDTSNHSMSPVYFTLRDDQGDTYGLAYITVPGDPKGDVVAGQQLRGDLSYEIPRTLHYVILQFDSPTDFDGSQIVQWNLMI